MGVQADPSPRAASLKGRFATRARDFNSRERWGYIVWAAIGAIIAVPEIWALAGDPPWPTISATVGRLESLWTPTAVIVVALIAAAAVHAFRYPWQRTGKIAETAGGRQRGRTLNGRFTKEPDEIREVSVYAYLALAVLVIIAGSLLAAALSSSRWVLAYVLYGLIAVFGVIIPNTLAYWFSRDVPFPTLFHTVADVERRWHPAALVIGAGLAVLLVHLALYPWPDVFRHVTPGSP